jgi:hypothetical protein
MASGGGAAAAPGRWRRLAPTAAGAAALPVLALAALLLAGGGSDLLGRAPLLWAQPQRRPHSGEQRGPRLRAPAPLLSGEALRFPYGRCWDGSGEQCRRPFAWRALNELELATVYSEAELRCATEDRCPLTLLETGEKGMCCIGATSGGGGLNSELSCLGALSESSRLQPEPRPLGQQRFLAHYERVLEISGAPGRALFELPDALALLPSGSRVHVIGDSVMAQVFDGLLCSLSRDARVTVMARRSFPRVKVRWDVGAAVRLEVDVALRVGAHDGGTSNVSDSRNYSLVFHREFRFSEDGATIREICTDADVLMFNYGAHWNNRDQLVRDAPHLARAVEDHCTNRSVQVVFRGTASQHFLTRDGLYDEDLVSHLEVLRLDGVNESAIAAVNASRKGWTTWSAGCSRIHSFEPERAYEWRNHAILAAFASRGYAVAITPWGAPATGCAEPPLNNSSKILFYIPFGEVTMSRFDLHRNECTHYCSTPALWNAVADGLYLALRQRDAALCDQPVARASLGAARPDGLARPRDPALPKATRANDPHFQTSALPGLIYKHA